jgi:hypothetical protein
MGTARHHRLILGTAVLLAAAQGGAVLSRGLAEGGEQPAQLTAHSLLAAQADGRGRWTPVLLQQQTAGRCWVPDANGRLVALETATTHSGACSLGSLSARLSLQPPDNSSPGNWRFQLRRQGSNLILQARHWRHGSSLDVASGVDPNGDRNGRVASSGELIALTPGDSWTLQGSRLVAAGTDATLAAGLPPPPPPLNSPGDRQRVVALAVIPWRPVDKLVTGP